MYTRLFVLSALLGFLTLSFAHGDLYGRALEEHYRRQASVSKCAPALRARHSARMDRVHARRADILGNAVAARCEDSTTTTSTISPTSSPAGSGVLSGSMPSGSGVVPSGAMGNGTGMAGNGTGMAGGGMGGGAGTTYTPTGTAVTTFNTSLSVPIASATAGAAPASQTTQASDGACALSPEQEEGPYYIPGEMIRSYIVENQTGIPFYMEFSLIDINTCEPLVGAAVDIWSCNATGDYAGFAEGTTATTGITTGTNGTNATSTDNSTFSGLLLHVGDQNDVGSAIEDNSTFLRGIQLTDDAGNAYFTSIVPGWYSGRAPHIHMRIHVGGNVTANGTYVGGNLTHTGQTFFGEDLYSQIQNIFPYTDDHVARTLNEDDRPWTQENGTYSAWNLFYVVEGDVKQGLIGVMNLAVDSTTTDQIGVDTGAAAGGGGVTP